MMSVPVAEFPQDTQLNEEGLSYGDLSTRILTVWVLLSSYVLFNVLSLVTRVPDPLSSAIGLWHSSFVRHRLLRPLSLFLF